jgi:hypothetical protein
MPMYEKCIQSFGLEIWGKKKNKPLTGGQSIDGIIILKFVFINLFMRVIVVQPPREGFS